DRKSTRLNSSHVSISYAVFCLKKKVFCALSAILRAVSLYLACSLTACKIATEIQNLPGDSLILFWILFNVFVVAMLALDLGVFHRRAHEVRFREALAWSAMWIVLAATFAALIFFWHGRVPALEFVTGYTIELSLSVDNLFVFLLIFRYFRVPG